MQQKPTHASGIRDNHSRGSTGKFIEAGLTSETDLSIVSAYFTIHAYKKLKDKLDEIKGLRFLFGEPGFVGNVGGDKNASREFEITEQGLTLSNQLKQRSIARECAEWIDRKEICVRSVVRSGFLHGKMYHLNNGGLAQALLGSSNFTVSGLGLGSSGGNVELNLIIDSDRDRADLLAWFNEWWEDGTRTEDVKGKVLEELGRIYANQAPDFIYYLTLFNIFRDFLDQKDDTENNLLDVKLPDTYVWQKLYKFQKDAAKAAINKIKNLNGCILADSVGLGKTYTALAVIKYFELKNERVLVLCPKKLSQNWMVYRTNSTMNPFVEDKFRYDLLFHTDLSRQSGEAGRGIDLATLNWGNYDLLVIDESHNFRNNNRATQVAGEERKRTRYEKLLEDIIGSGANTKVLLVSATPVNTDLSDLRNQLSFIAGGDVTRDNNADYKFSKILDIESIHYTTRNAQRKFIEWTNNPKAQRNKDSLLKEIGGDFFRLLDGLSIARSRSHIKRYYQEEMEQYGGFPNRTKPSSLHPPISYQDNYVSFENLNKKIDQLKLALYYPSGYLRDDLAEKIRRQYENEIFKGLTQEGRERTLIGMMKINFLKRLESSVDSFRLTLSRTIQKIDSRVEELVEFEQHQINDPGIDYANLMLEDLDDPELEDSEFIVGGKRKFHLGHIDIEQWRKDMLYDRDQLDELHEQMKAVTVDRDAKLGVLWNEIRSKFDKPTLVQDEYKNYKVLIFTAYADTARYLYEHLCDRIQKRGKHVAQVCGDGGNKTTLGKVDYDSILTNFSPVSKLRAQQAGFPQSEEIDVLIATDCISEGQNLQDCDLVVNYDIHWNPVRIVQRFGRIDRIGSRNTDVHLTNFWPVHDLDKYLNVKHRVEQRMALVDLSATQTDNPLEDSKLKKLVASELQFRDQQVKRLHDEILDLEDFNESITLSDFSLDEFRLDLLNFLESRRSELEIAKPGLYAVVPPVDGNRVSQSGALFCLRHRGVGEMEVAAGQDSRRINLLGNYYLVYVLDDGTVRLTFTQAKKILDLWRELSVGRGAPCQLLCDLFDEQTNGGANMVHYDDLIQQALVSIKNKFSDQKKDKLHFDRNLVIPKAQHVPTDDKSRYELITWLVVSDQSRVRTVAP